MSATNGYENEEAVSQYLAFHYETKEEILADSAAAAYLPPPAFGFAQRCAWKCIEAFDAYADEGVPLRALDVGCAVGRSSFELTCAFEEVVGIDFAHSFINAANTMKTEGSMKYRMLIEGNLYLDRVAHVPTSDADGDGDGDGNGHEEKKQRTSKRGRGEGKIDSSLVSFEQGDACNLRPDLGSFGCVLAANLICRLPDPKAFIDRLVSLTADGGVVVLLTPFSWMEEYTPKEKWLGGVTEGGKEVRSGDVLRSMMEARGFSHCEQGVMPFLIRETTRKNALTCSDLSVWKKLKKP